MDLSASSSSTSTISPRRPRTIRFDPVPQHLEASASPWSHDDNHHHHNHHNYDHHNNNYHNHNNNNIHPSQIWYTKSEYQAIRDHERVILQRVFQGTFIEGDGDSIRGLENRLRDLQKNDKVQAFRAVFREQSEQNALGYSDPAAIAARYAAKTADSRALAHAVGRLDARMAAEIRAAFVQEQRRRGSSLNHNSTTAAVRRRKSLEFTTPRLFRRSSLDSLFGAAGANTANNANANTTTGNHNSRDAQPSRRQQQSNNNNNHRRNSLSKTLANLTGGNSNNNIPKTKNHSKTTNDAASTGDVSVDSFDTLSAKKELRQQQKKLHKQQQQQQHLRASDSNDERPNRRAPEQERPRRASVNNKKKASPQANHHDYHYHHHATTTTTMKTTTPTTNSHSSKQQQPPRRVMRRGSLNMGLTQMKQRVTTTSTNRRPSLDLFVGNHAQKKGHSSSFDDDDDATEPTCTSDISDDSAGRRGQPMCGRTEL